MPAKRGTSLWAETTPITKDISKEGQIAHRQKLELELIQTQMTQKPILRAEVYARALRASQNRKEDSEVLLRFDQ